MAGMPQNNSILYHLLILDIDNEIKDAEEYDC